MRLRGGAGWQYGASSFAPFVSAGSAPPTFTVSGTVLDHNGDPYVGVTAQVVIFPTGSPSSIGNVPINGDGTFSLFSIPAGTYDLKSEINSGDVDNVETWYDGAPSQEWATPIEVSGDVSGLTVQLLPAGINVTVGSLTLLTHAKANAVGALTLSGSDVTAWRDEVGGDDYVPEAIGGTQPTVTTLNGETAVQSTHGGPGFGKNLGATTQPPIGWFLVIQPDNVPISALIEPFAATTDTPFSFDAVIQQGVGAFTASTWTGAGFQVVTTLAQGSNPVVWIAWADVDDVGHFALIDSTATTAQATGAMNDPKIGDDVNIVGRLGFSGDRTMTGISGEYGAFVPDADWFANPLAHAASLAANLLAEWAS